MISKAFAITLLSVVLMLSSSVSFAQQSKGGGSAAGAAYNRLYNPATVETLSGEIVKVEKVVPIKGMSYGIHLQLKTDKETVPVHLGPAWFIDRQKIKFEKGDRIDVTGSRIKFNNAPAIIASEVKKGDTVLKLRDSSGVPVWAGRGRKY